MNVPKVGLLALASLCLPLNVFPSPGSTVTGKVTLSGAAPKYKPLDLAKQPECVRSRASNPLYPENVVTGPGNSLRNVVVYISAGDNDNSPTARPAAVFDQQEARLGRIDRHEHHARVPPRPGLAAERQGLPAAHRRFPEARLQAPHPPHFRIIRLLLGPFSQARRAKGTAPRRP